MLLVLALVVCYVAPSFRSTSYYRPTAVCSKSQAGERTPDSKVSCLCLCTCTRGKNIPTVGIILEVDFGVFIVPENSVLFCALQQQ